MTTNKQTELLPCPFCGGPAEMRLYDCQYWVQCIQCFNSTAADHDLECNASSAWNRRAQSAPEPVQGDDFCDGHCTWLEHRPGCPRHGVVQSEVEEIESWYGELPGPGADSAEVMTVAQHNRIMAAACAGRGEAVAYITWQAPSYEWELTMLCEPVFAEGEPLYLYESPANPDADHLRDSTKMVDAELVALLKDVQRLLSPEPIGVLSGMSDTATRLDWYSEMTPVRDRIDAKLAELKS